MSKYLNNTTLKLELGKLSDYTDISRFLKEHSILNYVYCFSSPNGVLKYGMSADLTGMYGERVYRQAGHLPGWKSRLSGSSGSDMRIICDDYREKYGVELDRKDVTLYILDMTNLDPEDATWPDLACKEVERHFINEYIERNGKAPIGNKDHESKLVERKKLVKAQYNALFE